MSELTISMPASKGIHAALALLWLSAIALLCRGTVTLEVGSDGSHSYYRVHRP